MVADLTGAADSGETRIALTGATGFVGRAVLQEISAGLEVTALARRVPDDAPAAGMRFVQGDLADRTALAALTERAYAVIHVAGLTRTLDPEAFEDVNVLGTQTLIEAARASGVRRFVFVSSLAAREPELSAYGASKRRAEVLVQASGLDWTIVRPPAVYGPRDGEMFELFQAAARFGVVPLPPPGRASLIHVDDLARLLLVLAGGGASGAVLEPDDGRPDGYSHAEMARMIGRSVGRPKVLAPHMPAPLLRLGARADTFLRRSKAKLTSDRAGYMAHPDWVARNDRRPPPELWRPAIAAEEGLAQTAAWYRTAGWL